MISRLLKELNFFYEDVILKQNYKMKRDRDVIGLTNMCLVFLKGKSRKDK